MVVGTPTYMEGNKIHVTARWGTLDAEPWHEATVLQYTLGGDEGIGDPTKLGMKEIE